MPIEWSGLSPELLLALDRRDSEPLRSQLEGQLREAIRSGRLRVGERLPSSRELARELGLSRGLVQDCYGQLQAEGYLNTGLARPPGEPREQSSRRRWRTGYRAAISHGRLPAWRTRPGELSARRLAVGVA